ncbi:hypothetical protein ACLQ26_28730 [Micromonospora sp. DT43]|uniref:hypothetical protein n=1 Tax=Micromonospora sp. DT43 TaxID=3393440 RepID=UPI003CF2A01A
MRVDAASPYEVRRSRLWTGLALALYSLLPVTAIVIGLGNLSELFLFFVIGLVFETIFVGTMLGTIRSALRQELLFAIDEQGVYLGPDQYGRPAIREQWSRIDFVVHFQGRVWTTQSIPKVVRNVGFARDGRIVTSRVMNGWRLNVKRASAAAARFGGGTQVLKAPYHGEIPREAIYTLALPPQWLAAHARPGARRLPPEVTGTPH